MVHNLLYKAFSLALLQIGMGCFLDKNDMAANKNVVLKVYPQASCDLHKYKCFLFFCHMSTLQPRMQPQGQLELLNNSSKGSTTKVNLPQ